MVTIHGNPEIRVRAQQRGSVMRSYDVTSCSGKIEYRSIVQVVVQGHYAQEREGGVKHGEKLIWLEGELVGEHIHSYKKLIYTFTYKL
jgi:hypothetical protein